jgi:hypothetical protein
VATSSEWRAGRGREASLRERIQQQLGETRSAAERSGNSWNSRSSRKK